MVGMIICWAMGGRIRSVSTLQEKEIDNLSIMYEGDTKRDASSKIRGFLFQDYVAIECLLKSDVTCVCSECLEDVDVFYEDNTFEFIQVKHYPKTDPDMKEISTDLYYQYLRLKMLHSAFKTIPSLYIHREEAIEKQTVEKMEKYIEVGDEFPESVTYLEKEDSTKWLRDNIYTVIKKKEQKEKLFATMASKTSLEEFVDKLNICHKPNINQYREDLMKELVRVYPHSASDKGEKYQQQILLGLAVSYIQRRYMQDNPCFDQLKVDKKEFNQYMEKAVGIKPEQEITSYLTDLVCEIYSEIITYENLSDLQICMLNLIRKNTIQWINTISKTVDGQYQFVNTFSVEESERITDFKTETVNIRFRYITECKRDFHNFLRYLWKIMLNICQDQVHGEEEISAHFELFDPLHYVVSSITEYICLNFPEDKCINRTVILPRAGGNFNGIKRKIAKRMVHMPQKPEKWFFGDSKVMRGKNYYQYSTANVIENPTIVNLGEDAFYIECMECIKIEEGQWNKRDICKNCIFCEKCIKEGNNDDITRRV